METKYEKNIKVKIYSILIVVALSWSRTQFQKL